MKWVIKGGLFLSLILLTVMNGGFVVLAFLPIILYFVLSVFGIYFVNEVIKFMNTKAKSDQERNQKIDELIKVVSQGKSME
ncbi:hypothetical protein [Neobacillus sp. PS3-40]|uniref:hypothetical protein n=1 Tax=Neobacillus sp. PS3-40 TaxID=3070679 RepID=UPI0027E1B9BC|nr:hypothetical protein [Neobacillus sp. PS3-40]WML45419.1 hypothetical protein RCG20_05820 [Neobacillus sp. PS3-40]